MNMMGAGQALLALGVFGTLVSLAVGIPFVSYLAGAAAGVGLFCWPLGIIEERLKEIRDRLTPPD